MTARLVDVLCCCGWAGQLLTTASCPSCGRDWHDRVTRDRLTVLRAVATSATADVPRAMEPRLFALGLITRGARREPAERSTPHRPGREHGLTEHGRRVLAASDRAQIERAAAKLGEPLPEACGGMQAR